MNSNFQDLLDRQAHLNLRKPECEVLKANPRSKPQTANRSATLYQFIEMIDRIMGLTMPKVKFIPDEGKVLDLDSMADFNNPIITYKIIERVPKAELKPRVRESIVEKDEVNGDRVGEVYGQKFKCLVQFNMFASVYKEAEEVMEKFEELITTYTGFFKENGVAEILFKEHSTDNHYAKLRETLSIRNLTYYVEIEKLTVIFKEKIKEIEIMAQKKEDN